MNKRELFYQSFQKWGFGSQVAMLAEEAGELVVATLHLNRSIKTDTKEKQDATFERFAEEIADVEFLIEEFKDYFDAKGFNLTEKIKIIRAIKEKRLETLLSIEGK